MALSKRKLKRKHKVINNYLVFLRLTLLLTKVERDVSDAQFVDYPYQHIYDAVNYQERHNRFSLKFMWKVYNKHRITLKCYLNN